MTASYSNNDITLYSSYLEDLTGVATIKLTSKINCCPTQYEKNIALIDVSLGEIVIDGADFYGVENIKDAIYSFEIAVTYSNGAVRRLNACLFVDNETGCKVAEHVKDIPSLELQMDYFILKQASECGCECDSFCTIFERVLKELGVIECDLCEDNTICSEC
jgi:hypothetical protein